MRTYSVIKSDRGDTWPGMETVVETGLPLAHAHRRAATLQFEEDRLHPERSSWTKTLFGIRLETVLTYSVMRQSPDGAHMMVESGLTLEAARVRQSRRRIYEPDSMFYLVLES